MTDELPQKREAAEKSSIVERMIMRVEELGGAVNPDRKRLLKAMTKSELEELAGDVLGISTAPEAVTLIVQAIAHSDEERRKAEDERLAGGSAEVSL